MTAPIDDTGPYVERQRGRPQPMSPLILAGTVVSFLLMGFFVYTLAQAAFAGPQRAATNRALIEQSCVNRNEQITAVNEKNSQLIALFDISIAKNEAEGEPLDPALRALFEEYRKPIPLSDCDLPPVEK